MVSNKVWETWVSLINFKTYMTYVSQWISKTFSLNHASLPTHLFALFICPSVCKSVSPELCRGSYQAYYIPLPSRWESQLVYSPFMRAISKNRLLRVLDVTEANIPIFITWNSWKEFKTHVHVWICPATSKVAYLEHQNVNCSNNYLFKDDTCSSFY